MIISESRSLTRYLTRNASFSVQGRSYLSTFMPRRWLKDKSGRRCSVTERQREKERREIHGPRWLAFEPRYFHFQRAAIQGPRDFLRPYVVRASFLVFFRDVSHLAALRRKRKKKEGKKERKRGTRSRPEHRSHVCAICGPVGAEWKTEARSQDFFSSLDRE